MPIRRHSPHPAVSRRCRVLAIRIMVTAGIVLLACAGPVEPAGAQTALDTLELPAAARDRIARLSQQADGRWNQPEALELAERGRRARSLLVLDGDLESYRALTEGHIYFFVDPEEGERALIRVDQIAVELFWRAPDRVRQRLVGERSETRLPVRDFAYYLDRLTLVQYGFGDEIEVGQGMDVSGVPHPLAPLPDPEANGPYDFRIGDSLTLRLPGDPDPLRVRELEVRPRDPDAPGMLGSIWLDQQSAQLVRMEFSFTPASYVDPRTDRIAVELDYGRWEGRYWLPNLQRIEVRREIPELDLGVGTVIRAVLRVGEYDLNAPVPDLIAQGPPVTSFPEEDLRDYEFRQGLLGSLERDGLAGVATRADPSELRVEAARRLRNRPPTGLSPVRLHVPDLSSFLSYDRARGLHVGAGLSLRPRGAWRLRLAGGWSFGPDRPRVEAVLDGLALGDWTVELSGRWEGREDLGMRPGASDLVSSIGAALVSEDYRDPYRVRGAGLTLQRTLSRGSRVRIQAGVEDHRSETLDRETAPWRSSRSYRPLLPVAEGSRARLGLGWTEPIDALGSGGRGSATAAADLLAGPDDAGARVAIAMDGRWQSPSGVRDLALDVDAGTIMGTRLPQLHRLLGGRGTLPGHPFHRYAGERSGVASLVAAHDLGTPMVRVRGGLHLGWSDGRLPSAWLDPAGMPAAEDLRPIGTNGLQSAVSAGLGLFWDLVRVDGARGFGPEGEWQLLISVDPLWWDML